jgi:hypothetical protein
MMNKLFEEICTELCNVAEALQPYINQGFSDNYQLPRITIQELINRVCQLVGKIKDHQPIEVDDETPFKVIPEKLQKLITGKIPYLFVNGNSYALLAYLQTIDHIEHLLEPLFSWEAIADKNLMPKKLSNKLRGIAAEIKKITPDKEKLENQIRLIQEATETAESLPTDLASLAEAKEQMTEMAKTSEKTWAKIQQQHQEIENLMNVLKEHKEEANTVIQQSKEALQMATTKGLAGAFDQRAKELKMSMRYWVGLLILALGIGGWLGYEKMQDFLQLIKDSKATSDFIWIYMILALASFGAPLWFAWLASKQIGQRFKLAEDYAFKASVAKAYEGYKTEAARLDKDFEARLFSSALTRLEEAPLRFMNNTEHSSPVHEMIKLCTPAKTQQTESKQPVKTEPE